jgi:hypothetical protein
MLVLSIVVGTFVFSTDIAEGDSAGNALIDALIVFVIFGAWNLLLVALMNGWRPAIGWLSPRRAWLAVAGIAPILLIAIVTERSGIDEGLIVAVPLVAVAIWFSVRHIHRT